MMAADMDQSMEIATTVLDREPHNIDALRVRHPLHVFVHIWDVFWYFYIQRTH